MQNLSVFNKFLFFLNIILACAMLVGFALPYIAPKQIPILAVLTLGLPILLLINIIFLFYWAVQLKRQLWLSLLFLILGFPFFKLLYKVSDSVKDVESNDLTILSYNVHLFNKFEWMPDLDVTTDINNFIEQINPDVVCLQEFTPINKKLMAQYPYQHVVTKGKNIESGLAIFSKYPFVNTGNLNFKNTFNNTIFADILVNGQPVRIYTMHLESLGIATDLSDNVESLAEGESKSKRIFKKAQTAFLDQQEQAETILKHRQGINFPVIITGDMNNSAFSYAYKTIRGNLNDAFVEAGQGFGKSYNFKLFPFRIDYILVDKNLEIKEFKTFNEIKKSDHYPIYARIKIKKEDG